MLKDNIFFFHEVDTLWRLAISKRPIKDAFLKKLFGSQALSNRFARKPCEITRALVELDS